VIDDEPIALRSSSVAQEDPPPPDLDGYDFDAFERSIVPIGVPHDPFYVARNPDGTKRLVPYKPRIRNVREVTGVCLHQTATVMGENPARYRRLSIHFVITRSGKVIQTCNVLSLLLGGNGWNNGTIQIEMDGLLPGLLDDPTTINRREDLDTTWNDPDTPVRDQPMSVTDEQKRSLRNLIRYLDELVRRLGGALRVIVAHRQSSGSRQNDPGQETWAEALTMMDELGLSSGGAGFKLDDGRPICEAWDPRCKGIPY
jgi:hypothetical protein